MSQQAAQNFENHAVAPKGLLYATVVILIGVITVIVGLFNVTSVMGLCLVGTGSMICGLATIFGLGLARTYAIGVQDRVIRLEMRLRLREVLPAEMQADILRLSKKQLIGLRFGSDEELPELIRWVLADGITDLKQIKQKVTNWQADVERI
jgi:hypothetical protein